ncbi:MAG TPA: hypothetical protein DD465_07315, partial [Thalassospira sp.]|nr:hypothetical protein [Thalassospira sp.]
MQNDADLTRGKPGAGKPDGFKGKEFGSADIAGCNCCDVRRFGTNDFGAVIQNTVEYPQMLPGRVFTP